MKFKLDRHPDGRISMTGRIERLEMIVQILFVLIVILAAVVVFV